MDHVTRATPLSRMIRRLTFDIACKHTKFDDSIASAVPEIFQACEILEASCGPDHAHLGDSCRLVLFVAKPCTKFVVCTLAVPKIFLDVKF